MQIVRWLDYESWKEYGLNNSYNEKNPKSLIRSKNKTERSWYVKGQKKGWLENFGFKKKFLYTFKDFSFEEWRKYGLDHGYYERNPSSLSKSKNKMERSWYGKGIREKWLGKFEFKRKYSDCSDWQTCEDWKEYGLTHMYNERNPFSLSESKNKEERSWYTKGQRRGWLENFGFKKIRLYNLFNNFKEWKQYGIDKEFNERNRTSLQNSKNKEERSWYQKGQKNKWLKDFEFKAKLVIGRWYNLEQILEEAAKIVKDNNLKEFPSSRKLKKIGRFDLANAISMYHNGFPAFREKLREYLGLPSEKNQLESLLESYVSGGEQHG